MHTVHRHVHSPVAAAGPFVTILVGALEGTAVVGGLSALGAALASIGVSKEGIVKYQTQLKADKYLVIAHGNAKEVGQARSIMERAQATETEAIAA